MKKILHMTPPDINNGVYRYIFNHMQFMDDQRFQHAFLTKGAEELRNTYEYEKYGFEVYELNGTQRDNVEEFRREIIGILKNGFDIIHLHTSSWRGFMIEEIAMERHLPRVIVHSHSTGIDENDFKAREERIRVHEAFKHQFSMKYATDVWACSSLAADWLYGSQIPRNRIQILPNAIETERYRFSTERRRQMRQKLNLTDRIVIGNIGRYTFQKNQEFLISAFAEAHKIKPELYLLCIGEGELLPQLRELICSLEIANSVFCLEWQKNIEDYLQAMDIFCLTSRFEGFPISVIEAQTAGLRCLVSDMVTREIEITDLVTFLPLTQDRWVQEILNSDNQYPRKGRDMEAAHAGYDIRLAVKKLETLYEEEPEIE